MATSRRADTLLAGARAAVSRLAWDEAVAAFAGADTENPAALTPGDRRQWALAAYLRGDVATATATLIRAHHDALVADDRAEAMRGVFWLVYVLITAGDGAQASGWATRCEALADSMEPGGVGEAYRLALASHRAAMHHDTEAALDLAARGAAAARRCREGDVLALLLNTEGRVLLRSGRLPEGWARLDECLVQVVSGDLSPVAVGTVYCSLIEACEELGEVARVREWTDALTRWCERQSGMATFLGQCLTHRSFVLWLEGSYQAAAEAAVTACDRFAGAADVAATGRAFDRLGEARLRQGRLDDAEAAFLQAAEWGADPQPGLALLRLAQGDADTAAAMIRRVLAERPEPLERLRPLPAAVEILLAVDDVEGARAACHELAAAAERFGTSAVRAASPPPRPRSPSPTAGPSSPRRVAGTPSAGGASSTCRTSRRCAVTSSVGPVPHSATRRPPGSSATLPAARSSCCARRSTPPRHGPTATEPIGTPDRGLSPRELEVLRLVATGRTNRQVAEELSLSVKTVDRHVGNLLAKLEVPSRTAAAAYAYEHGLVGGASPTDG